ncbi:MAG: hypothetical protein HC853_17720 [Anaerolineae bacterium]|nr:hypothetical protein [Anaerolineae bacterium]
MGQRTTAGVCAKLTDAQLDATISGTFGTIRDTLHHIVTSERSYFSRISTGQRYSRPADVPPLTLAEMIESAWQTGQGLVAWAAKVQPADAVQIKWLHGEMVAVPLTLFLTQVINHATEHRAQIMAILTQLGVQPPSLDGWTYFAAQNGLPA